MAVLKTALTAFMASTVFVAVGAGWRVATGRPIRTDGSELTILIAAIWVIVFVALVIMDGLRETLYRRATERSSGNGQRETIARRFIIAAAAFSLALGRIAMLHLGDELTPSLAVYYIASSAFFAIIAVLVVESIASRRRKTR